VRGEFHVVFEMIGIIAKDEVDAGVGVVPADASVERVAGVAVAGDVVDVPGKGRAGLELCSRGVDCAKSDGGLWKLDQRLASADGSRIAGRADGEAVGAGFERGGENRRGKESGANEKNNETHGGETSGGRER